MVGSRITAASIRFKNATWKLLRTTEEAEAGRRNQNGIKRKRRQTPDVRAKLAKFLPRFGLCLSPPPIRGFVVSSFWFFSLSLYASRIVCPIPYTYISGCSADHRFFSLYAHLPFDLDPIDIYNVFDLDSCDLVIDYWVTSDNRKW